MSEPYLVLENHDKKADYGEYAYLYYTLPILKNVHCMVETGLGTGSSTRIFLESLSQLPNPETRVLHTWDILDNDVSRSTPAMIRSLNFSARWEFHHGDSLQGGRVFDAMPIDSHGIIDMMYLDADHAYESVMGELNTFAPFLSNDAIIFTHDSMPNIVHSTYTKGEGKPSTTYEALRDWAQLHGYRILLYPHPQGITLAYKLPFEV